MTKCNIVVSSKRWYSSCYFSIPAKVQLSRQTLEVCISAPSCDTSVYTTQTIVLKQVVSTAWGFLYIYISRWQHSQISSANVCTLIRWEVDLGPASTAGKPLLTRPSARSTCPGSAGYWTTSSASGTDENSTNLSAEQPLSCNSFFDASNCHDLNIRRGPCSPCSKVLLNTYAYACINIELSHGASWL